MDGFIGSLIRFLIVFFIIGLFTNNGKKKKTKQQQRQTTKANTSKATNKKPNNGRFAPLSEILEALRDELDDKPEMAKKQAKPQYSEGSFLDNEGSYGMLEGSPISTQGKEYGSEGKDESMQGKYIGMEGYVSQFSNYQPMGETKKPTKSKWDENAKSAYKVQKADENFKLFPDRLGKEELLRAVVMSEILNKPKFKSKYN